MIRFTLLLLCLFPVVSFAGEPSSGWSAIGDTIHSIGQFFSEIPDMVDRFLVYASRSVLLFYFQTKLHVLEFCYGMAASIISSFNVTSTIQGFVSGMPPKMQYCINELGFVNGISFLLNCWGTRFILNMIGW